MATLLIVAALKAVDKNIIHSSQDLGADSLSTLFGVIVPTAKSGIIVAFLIAFVSSLSDFGTPIIIGGGYNVLATEAYLNITGASNLPLASAMSVFLLIPSLIFFIIYRLLMKDNKMFSYHSFRSNKLDNCDLELPKWFINIFTTTMVTIGALIFLISPGKEVATVQLFSAIKEGDLEVGFILANMIIFTTLIVNLSLTKFLKEN